MATFDLERFMRACYINNPEQFLAHAKNLGVVFGEYRDGNLVKVVEAYASTLTISDKNPTKEDVVDFVGLDDFSETFNPESEFHQLTDNKFANISEQIIYLDRFWNTILPDISTTDSTYRYFLTPKEASLLFGKDITNVDDVYNELEDTDCEEGGFMYEVNPYINCGLLLEDGCYSFVINPDNPGKFIKDIEYPQHTLSWASLNLNDKSLSWCLNYREDFDTMSDDVFKKLYILTTLISAVEAVNMFAGMFNWNEIIKKRKELIGGFADVKYHNVSCVFS